nr:DUF1540 domain-containing protein [bacterium]
MDKMRCNATECAFNGKRRCFAPMIRVLPDGAKGAACATHMLRTHAEDVHFNMLEGGQTVQFAIMEAGQELSPNDMPCDPPRVECTAIDCKKNRDYTCQADFLAIGRAHRPPSAYRDAEFAQELDPGGETRCRSPLDGTAVCRRPSAQASRPKAGADAPCASYDPRTITFAE